MEVRYDASLAFYAAMDKIGLSLADGYPDWQRSPLALEVRNKKHRRRCFFSHQRAFFEAVDFQAEGTEFDQAAKLLDRLYHERLLTKARRIGIRQWSSVKAEQPFAELVKAVAKRFQPRSEQLDKILRGRTEDLAYEVIVMTDTGWKYHLRLGPMERKQWFEVIPYEPGMFESPEEFKKYQDSLPERMVFIDVDCYQEEVTYSEISSLIASMRRVSAEIASDLINYLRE